MAQTAAKLRRVETNPNIQGSPASHDQMSGELEIEEISNKEADDEHTDDQDGDEPETGRMEECAPMLNDTDFM
jgi:hypothetical protein